MKTVPCLVPHFEMDMAGPQPSMKTRVELNFRSLCAAGIFSRVSSKSPVLSTTYQQGSSSFSGGLIFSFLFWGFKLVEGLGEPRRRTGGASGGRRPRHAAEPGPGG